MVKLHLLHHHHRPISIPFVFSPHSYYKSSKDVQKFIMVLNIEKTTIRNTPHNMPVLQLKPTSPRLLTTRRFCSTSPASEPLDLTEDNIELVLSSARVELAQIFDTSVGMTGEVELADLDGPFVKIRLRGRFWHKRSTVLARVGNYLKQRIPEILEVDIENEKQLDDSPANF